MPIFYGGWERVGLARFWGMGQSSGVRTEVCLDVVNRVVLFYTFSGSGLVGLCMCAFIFLSGVWSSIQEYGRTSTENSF